MRAYDDLTVRGIAMPVHGTDEEGSTTMADSERVEAVRGEFAYGSKTVDDESLRLHVKAEEILRERGKHEYSDEEYLAAVAEAERELGVVYRDRPAAA